MEMKLQLGDLLLNQAYSGTRQYLGMVVGIRRGPTAAYYDIEWYNGPTLGVYTSIGVTGQMTAIYRKIYLQHYGTT